MNNICVPFTNCFSLKEWRDNPYSINVNLRSYQVENILSQIGQLYENYTIRMFCIMYTSDNTKNVMFRAKTPEQYTHMYMPLDLSVYVMLKIIFFQCDYVNDKVSEFFKTLYNVLNKYNGKQNTIWVKSENSAGKNFFFDSVCDAFLLVGTVQNPIRGYVFGFQDCADKRIILWNEAAGDPYFYEAVKPILSGDCPRVQVKNQSGSTVSKTPVIVLSNRNTFPDNDEFNCRIVKYEWCKCELLKLYTQKPDPRAAILLLMYFNEKSKMFSSDVTMCDNQLTLLLERINELGKNYWEQ